MAEDRVDELMKNKEQGMEVWTLPITPEIRSKVLKEGMTLLSKKVTDKIS